MDSTRGTVDQGNKGLLLLTIRQALLMMVGAIEVYLGMERSVVPKRKRERVLDNN